MSAEKQPYLIVLGIAQDGGVPQAGTKDHRGWREDAFKHHVVCVAIVDPERSTRWMVESTPDFPEQLHMLDDIAPVDRTPGLEAIFLTHAHIGHYTGLMWFGHEAMGTQEVSVYAMPRMAAYLKTNGPWSHLLRNANITLKPLSNGIPVPLTSNLTIEPFRVPHREEYSETVGYRIEGPSRSALFIPDVDSWEAWDEEGTRVEELISRADVAYLDGTFYTETEVTGRRVSTFPHPAITHTMRRLGSLSPEDRRKVRFIHLNHTNLALIPGGEARRAIEGSGFRVAEEMERVEL